MRGRQASRTTGNTSLIVEQWLRSGTFLRIGAAPVNQLASRVWRLIQGVQQALTGAVERRIQRAGGQCAEGNGGGNPDNCVHGVPRFGG